MVRDILRLDFCRIFGLKTFEPSGENPYCVAVNSDDPRVSLFT